MKNSLLYTFIFLHLLACNSSTESIEKIWISKYLVSHNEMGEEVIHSSTFRGFFAFDKDSVVIKDFEFIAAAKNRIGKFKYSLRDSSLIIFRSNGNDSMQISQSDTQLILSVSPTMNHVFEVLPSYNQAKAEQKLFEELTSSTYKIVTDTFEVFYEFQKDYTSFNTTPHPKLFIEKIINWKLNSSGTELFLELGDFNGNALHIKEITEKEIKGVIYGEEDREVLLEKVLPKNNFDLANLIGEWEEIIDYPLPPPPPPPPVGVRYYEKELLKISENELIRHRFLGSDTVQWQMNRLKDKLFIPTYFHKIGAWTIEKLEDEYLTIKRKRIYSRGLGFRWAGRDRGQANLTQEVKFKKIKKTE